MSGREKRTHCVIGVTLAMVLLLSAGCATMDYRKAYSGQLISQAEKAVDEAIASKASQNAPAELKVAEEKLSRAREAFAKEEHDKASRLAEEAAVDAQYAQTKATTERNKKTVGEMRKNIEVMRQDIERQSK